MGYWTFLTVGDIFSTREGINPCLWQTGVRILPFENWGSAMCLKTISKSPSERSFGIRDILLLMWWGSPLV